MSSKHEKLVAAVSDAMAAQGFTQKQVANMGGCAASMISQALNQGVTLKDERWKMICEGLGLNYDDIVADMPQKTASSVSPQADCHLPIKVGQKPDEQERLLADRHAKPEAAVRQIQAAPGEGKETVSPVKNCGGTEVPLSEEHNSKEDRDNLFLLAMYAEGCLAKDIEAGMKVDPMKLWGILDALKKIKDNALKPE